jgi:2-C-methyl-D-erythritol 4-phosphate cytidylyltransferase
MVLALPADLDRLQLGGRSLTEHAVAALQAAGVRDSVRSDQDCLVLHDPACPGTPAGFVAALVASGGRTGRVQVGVRPLTDTVKTVNRGVVGDTVDRELLVALASPVVLPPLVQAPDGTLAEVVDALRTTHDLELVSAPALARRVYDVSDIRLLEALAPELLR